MFFHVDDEADKVESGGDLVTDGDGGGSHGGGRS